MRAAAIDIGSNSVKFLVAEKEGGRLRVIGEESHSTRLAAELISTGILAEESMERTLKVLTQIKSKAAELGAKRFQAVATSAVRDAGNGKDFLKRAKEALGFPVTLLSGEEEAEGIFAGVASDARREGSDLCVMDIGGGSAEWILGRGISIAQKKSLPVGCVRLKERFKLSFPAERGEVRQVCDFLREALSGELADYDLEGRRLVGTGGTLTCLAGMELRLKKFNPKKIDGTVLARSQVAARLEFLQKLNWGELGKVPGLPAKRKDLILMGAAVTLVSMEILKAKEIAVSVRGLRYGVVERLLAKK